MECLIKNVVENMAMDLGHKYTLDWVPSLGVNTAKNARQTTIYF